MIIAFYMDLPEQFRRFIPKGCSAKIHGSPHVKCVEVIPPARLRRKVRNVSAMYIHSPGNAARRAGAHMRRMMEMA